jgi:hypothetical protein
MKIIKYTAASLILASASVMAGTNNNFNVGLGLEDPLMQGGGSSNTVLVPMTFTAGGIAWLIEPRLSLPYQKNDTTTTNASTSCTITAGTGCNVNTKVSNAPDEGTTGISVGIFATQTKGNITMYYGASIGQENVNNAGNGTVTTASTQYSNSGGSVGDLASTAGASTSTTVKTTSTDNTTYFAPTLGANYNITAQLSLGLEASLRIISGDRTLDTSTTVDSGTSTATTSANSVDEQETKTKLVLRYMF